MRSRKAVEASPATIPEDQTGHGRGVRKGHRPHKGTQTQSTAPSQGCHRRGARPSQVSWVSSQHTPKKKKLNKDTNMEVLSGLLEGPDGETRGHCEEQNVWVPQMHTLEP